MNDETLRTHVRADIIAGFTTAVMLVPQAMAYAMLAGLPPVVGLYASTFPLLAYALIGTSRQLAIGPVAMDSLLVATSLGAVAVVGPEHRVALAAGLAALVGLIQVGFGLGRAGLLANLLSRPVIGGFTSAAALVIALSQLQPLLGVDVPSSTRPLEIVAAAWSARTLVQPLTLAIGVGSILALISMRRYLPAWPRAVIVVVVGTGLAAALNLGAQGVATVGVVPAGLPSWSWPHVSWEEMRDLLGSAMAIAVVSFMEAISVGRALAARHGQTVDPNRELVGLGAANLVAGLVGGYAVAGGLSRSAVNDDAGARSKLAGVVTAAVVMGTLVALTPLFEPLPTAVLAAVIVTSVAPLVDIGEIRRLWRVDRRDLGLFALTSVATLGWGIQNGIGVGVGVSVLLFIVRALASKKADVSAV